MSDIMHFFLPRPVSTDKRALEHDACSVSQHRAQLILNTLEMASVFVCLTVSPMRA